MEWNEMTLIFKKFGKLERLIHRTYERN
jgi:hypothetical protein